MNKLKEYIKKNYLFVGLIAFILVLIIILVVVRLNNKQNLEWTPIEGDIPYEIKKHEANEYKIISVEDSDIAGAYYREWVYYLVNKPEQAYKMLGSKSKKEFDTYEKFEKWIKQFVTVKTKDSTATAYHFSKNGKYNEITVRSSENMRYRFNEKSVWNFTVDIIGQERVIQSTTMVTKKK